MKEQNLLARKKFLIPFLIFSTLAISGPYLGYFSFALLGFGLLLSFVMIYSSLTIGSDELTSKIEEEAAKITIIVFISTSLVLGGLFTAFGELSGRDTELIFGLLVFIAGVVLWLIYGIIFQFYKVFYETSPRKTLIGSVMILVIILVLIYVAYIGFAFLGE